MNDIAKEFYKQKGYKLLDEGYICIDGMIDLIFKDEDTYIFVDVVIAPSKFKLDFIKASDMYLQEKEIFNVFVQFEKFGMITDKKGQIIVHRKLIDFGVFTS